MKPFNMLSPRKAQSKAEPNVIESMRIKTVQMTKASVSDEFQCEQWKNNANEEKHSGRRKTLRIVNVLRAGRARLSTRKSTEA